jgi:adenosylmethionine---8-amino-7-oxononanoate aminotransferase
VIFAGLTHGPAEDVARRVLALAPPGLAHAFFSDSGSTAVEVALKMALGFFRNRSQPRTRILALEHGYHGDTAGAMSAGARGVFSAAYEPMLFEVERVPFPAEGREQVTLDALETACRRGDTAALIVEPLILGAGGMLIYPASVLAEMQRICRRHSVLFIADEVMTGWGRTGTLFACEQAGVTPDIMCIAKGLTGGSIPLAVTLATAEIFEAHTSTDRSRALFHSSSYTANPIACAAALANLDIWAGEPVAGRIAALAAQQARHLTALARHPRVAATRQLGTIAAFDIEAGDAGYLSSIAMDVRRTALESGVLLRPLGNTVYVMPPYCMSEASVNQVYGAIDVALHAVSNKV